MDRHKIARQTCPIRQFRWLGLLPVGFFCLHAATRIHAGHPENLLWACHFANLLLGIGILARKPTLIAASTLVIMIGIPLWVVSVVYGGETYPTSYLTHLGGLTVGLIAVRKFGLPRDAWLLAVGIKAALLVVSRICTPASENVNAVFDPWLFSMPYLSEPDVYVVTLLSVWTLTLALVSWAFRSLLAWFPASPSSR